MKYGLDILLDHPLADVTRVAMTGLSGGGWQTIVFSALDPRITLWRYTNKKYPSPEEVSRVGLFGIIGIAFVLIFGTKLRPPDK